MIDASLYLSIYSLTSFVLTMVMSSIYSRMPDSRIDSQKPTSSITGWMIALIFAIFFGFRPISGYYFVDMAKYYFSYINGWGTHHTFDWNAGNYLFDNLILEMASLEIDPSVFFFVIALIYFLGTFVAMQKLFPKDALLGFVAFLGAFSTYSYGTNGIKAGAAAALFLCAIAYRHNRVLCLMFLFLTLGFHHSMIMPVAAFIICSFFKKPKYYFILWVACVLVAALHISAFQELFALMSDEQGAIYLNAIDTDWGGKSGFRIDFIIYSAMPVLVGYITIFKYKVKSENYNFILNLYMLTNAIWMLCMYAAFTNRIAYLSWLMYPVVLIYPFLNKRFMPRQYKMAITAVWYQLLFTLFMVYIYYGKAFK